MLLSQEFFDALSVESTMDGWSHYTGIEAGLWGIRDDLQGVGNPVLWRTACGVWFVTACRNRNGDYPLGDCERCREAMGEL